ncbi:hypothetical protein IE077_000576, partial [Cardiosporidium cionae]
PLSHSSSHFSETGPSSSLLEKSTDGKIYREKIPFEHRQDQPVSQWSSHQSIDEQMEDYRCLMKRFIFTNRYLLLSHLPSRLLRVYTLRRWVENLSEEGDVEVEILTNSEGHTVAHLTFKTKSSASKAYKKIESNTEGITVEHAPPRKANSCLWLGNVREFMCMQPLESDLKSIFESFGPIVRWKLMSGKNCGFVAYQNIEHAITARNHLYGLLFGREICLNIDFSPNDVSTDIYARRYRSVSPYSHRGGPSNRSMQTFRGRGRESGGHSPLPRRHYNEKEGEMYSDEYSPPGSGVGGRSSVRRREEGGSGGGSSSRLGPSTPSQRGKGAASTGRTMVTSKEQRAQHAENICNSLIANDPVKEALLELLANPDVLALAKERFLSDLPSGRASQRSSSRGRRRSPSGTLRFHRSTYSRPVASSRSRSPSSPSRGGRREGRRGKPLGGWISLPSKPPKSLSTAGRGKKGGIGGVEGASLRFGEGGASGVTLGHEEMKIEKGSEEGGSSHHSPSLKNGSPSRLMKERRLRSPLFTGKVRGGTHGKKCDEEGPPLLPSFLSGERSSATAKRPRLTAEDSSSFPSLQMPPSTLSSSHEEVDATSAVQKDSSGLLLLCKVSKQGQLMCNMSAKYIKGCSDMKPSESLNLGQRTHIDRLCSQLRKTQRFSLWQLGADTREDSRHYDELCDYFINKDRVGLLEFDCYDVYLVPPNSKYIQPLNLPDANFMYAFVVEKTE